MKFKFENGEVIEVFEESIARILKSDKRYKEVIEKENTKKGKNPKDENPKDENPKDENPKGDESDGEIQE